MASLQDQQQVMHRAVAAAGNGNSSSSQAATSVAGKMRIMPDFLQSVNLKYVKLGYHYVISHGLFLLMIPLMLAIAAEIGRLGQEDISQLWEHLQFNLVSILVCSAALVFVGTLYFMSRPRPVYLVDFACFKPDDERKMSMQMFMDTTERTGTFNKTSVEFQRKILERCGLGDETYLPPAIQSQPPNPCLREARLEAEMVMFGALDELFLKTGLKAKDIGILVVNCSLFTPTPSLSSMIVNHYKMRGNIVSMNLAS
jgi:3-ketoacyl-CoA synthase